MCNENLRRTCACVCQTQVVGNYFLKVEVSSDEDEELAARMAIRLPSPRIKADKTEDDVLLISLVFPDHEIGDVTDDGSAKPIGHDTKFTNGMFKGKTFHEVLHEFPQQYMVLRLYRKGNLAKDMQAFIDWVQSYYDVSKDGTVTPLHTRTNDVTQPKAKTSFCVNGCKHIHHKRVEHQVRQAYV